MEKELQDAARFYCIKDLKQENELIDQVCSLFALSMLDPESHLFAAVFFAMEEILDLRLKAKVLNKNNKLEISEKLNAQASTLEAKLNTVFSQGYDLVAEQTTQDLDYQEAYRQLEKVEASLSLPSV